jgi:uncharacterized protein YjiS (DUF1127 family)
VIDAQTAFQAALSGNYKVGKVYAQAENKWLLSRHIQVPGRSTTMHPIHRFRCLWAVVRAILRARRNREIARQMSDMHDTSLGDLGLKRDDIHKALRVGWRADPTYQLTMLRLRNIQDNR